MILNTAKALASMIARPSRPAGRGWSDELIRRTVRRFFNQAANKPSGWSRAQLEKLPVSRSLMRKVDCNQISLAGVECLDVQPAKGARSSSTIVYLHGGGYVTGSPNSYRGFIAALALACETRVIAPDYRLSPEYPLPLPQQDCAAVCEAVLLEEADKSVLLAGDSAGGALAVATSLALSSMSKNFSGLLLISPWVEPTANNGSMLEHDAHDIFSLPFLQRSIAAHVQDGDPHDARVNFLSSDLSCLPRTLIQSGAAELFHDQIGAFVTRASSQGVDVDWQPFKGQFHDFQVLAPGSQAGRAAMAAIVNFFTSAGSEAGNN